MAKGCLRGCRGCLRDCKGCQGCQDIERCSQGQSRERVVQRRQVSVSCVACRVCRAGASRHRSMSVTPPHPTHPTQHPTPTPLARPGKTKVPVKDRLALTKRASLNNIKPWHMSARQQRHPPQLSCKLWGREAGGDLTIVTVEDNQRREDEAGAPSVR